MVACAARRSDEGSVMAPGNTSGIASSIEGSRSVPDKIRENRLRRMAERQGLALRKSRRRDPRAVDFGTYMLVEPERAVIVAGERMSADDVERYLIGEGRQAR